MENYIMIGIVLIIGLGFLAIFEFITKKLNGCKRVRDLSKIVFDEISLGDSFEMICDRFNAIFSTKRCVPIKPTLSFEEKNGDIIKTIYTWTMPNDLYNLMPAFIKITFENSIAVKKEQEGL